MKKFLGFILAFVYLVVSTGIAINTHYCMDKVESVTVLGNGSDKCGKCGMPGNNEGCCKDEFKMLKLQDSHKQAEILVQLYAPQALLPIHTNFLAPVAYDEQNSTAKVFHSPPAGNFPSLNILNCVFRC